MMRLDREPVEEIEVESKSERHSSFSSSFSVKVRKVVDDIDTGCDFVGPSISLESIKEINRSPVREPGRTEEYDREAILHRLANCNNSGDERQMILDIIGLTTGYDRQKANISTIPFKISENEEMSAQDRQKSLVDGLRESLKAVPDSMLHLYTGSFRPIYRDCGPSMDQKPDWVDMDKLRRGQKFAQDHMFSVLYTELISLLAFYNFDDALKPIIISGNSSTPYAAFKRSLSTVLRVQHWYTQDPWKKGTDAWKDILVVRAKHASAKRRLNASTNEDIDKAAVIPNAWCTSREILLKDFSETCEAPVIGQCPYLLRKNNPHRPKSLNQMEMAATQWVFVGLITLYPKSVWIHNATDEDIEAYCHLWRSLGYQLGIEDEYNFCRGSITEIRERCRDFLDTWLKPNFREITPAWEHMGRCLMTGVRPLMPFASFDVAILQFLEIIELKVPRFYASLSYKDWIMYNSMRFLLDYGTKIPGVTGMVNAFLRMVLKRAEKLSPKGFKKMRIRLSNYAGNNTETQWNSVATNS